MNKNTNDRTSDSFSNDVEAELDRRLEEVRSGKYHSIEEVKSRIVAQREADPERFPAYSDGSTFKI